MADYCDFTEQQSITDENERRLRPDMLVRLPNDRQIVVDAKVPLDRFLTALEAAEDQRAALFRDHAQTIRKHVDETTKRAYYRQLPGAHEFTVMFIPGELFYHTALEHDHELLDYAFARNVIIAGPGTLIAVLKSAALGWREASLSREARKIQDEGRKVFESLGKVVEHLSKIGGGLGDAIKGYNAAVGSIEERLLPRARRLHELHMGDSLPAEITRVSAELRTFHRPELATHAQAEEGPSDLTC